MRLLLIGSAVGALGDGIVGGVSDQVRSTGNALCQRGHKVDILAAESSVYEGAAQFIGISGEYQPSIVAASHEYYPVVASSLIANYWRYVREHMAEYDAVLNFCQDWLPYYLTSFMAVPVLHLTNIGNENAVVTEQIQRTASEFPQRVAVMSRAQAESLGIAHNAFLCGYGFDFTPYPFSQHPQPDTLVWAARICAEKGLEDAAEIALRSNKKLLVCGYMQDTEYFARISARYGKVMDYRGFLDRPALVKLLGSAEAMLCTHTWMEAFGVSVVESLACGTPVVTYDRGGPAEIVTEGKTGFVVAADNIDQAVAAIAKAPFLRREDCRDICRAHYGLDVYAARLEQWIMRAYSPR